jgi:hypothetical protein
MDTAAPDKTSMLGLFRLLTADTRTFIRQEIQLVKTELSEKASHFGRNGAILAAGGAIAYAGLIVFLIGLSWLLAWLFEIAGLQPVLSGFLGLVIIGGLVIATGCMLLLKGLKTLKKEGLAPERTIRTLQELKGNGPAQPTVAKTEALPAPSSAEMQVRVEATEDRMVDTIDELGRRLSPQHINAEIKQRIQANPYRSGLIAMGAGLISGLFLRGKLRRA